MSREHGSAHRAATPRWLVVAVSVVIALGGSLVVLEGTGLVPRLDHALGISSLGSFGDWLWGLLLGALISGVALARTHLLRKRYRRSLAALLRQATELDHVKSARQQAALAQANAFSGQAAHQLRTPLAALGLAIEELTLHPETPRQVRADLARCRNEVDRLADVISDLLTLARRGSLPSGQSTTDPAAVALHATRRWASSARAAGRELRVAGTMPKCQVRAPQGPPPRCLTC
ncbi:MAG TPA: histidine kinase dimerization/phospho-acceptor domain-containing protein [Pedococcus sp.]|jgi:signal transduction histidine kinase|nr:histidine kinase dimerization/phospho-acceptor domain-containing protein [Pedococcus sp.]